MSAKSHRVFTAIAAMVAAVALLLASVAFTVSLATRQNAELVPMLRDFEGAAVPFDDESAPEDPLDGSTGMPEDGLGLPPGDAGDDGHVDGDAEGDHERLVDSYRVNGDSLEGSADPAHEKIWRRFATIVPVEYRKGIVTFEVVTDGRDGVVAAVGADETDPDNWTLAVDPADADDAAELDRTLIHEFTHILTLNETQVAARRSGTCRTYDTGEGCTRDGAYLNAFVSRFWADILPENREIAAIEDEEAWSTRVEEFFERYEDRFVTDYAATSPEEDIAESFTAFVFDGKPPAATAHDQRDQKVRFFAGYPELVSLRESIRSAL